VATDQIASFAELDSGRMTLAGCPLRRSQLSNQFASIRDPYFNNGMEMWTLDYYNDDGYVQS
jgi:hypothetical protein